MAWCSAWSRTGVTYTYMLVFAMHGAFQLCSAPCLLSTPTFGPHYFLHHPFSMFRTIIVFPVTRLLFFHAAKGQASLNESFPPISCLSAAIRVHCCCICSAQPVMHCFTYVQSVAVHGLEEKTAHNCTLICHAQPATVFAAHQSPHSAFAEIT